MNQEIKLEREREKSRGSNGFEREKTCLKKLDVLLLISLIVKFIALLVILDDLDVLLLIWLGFNLLGLEMFGMKFFVFS